MYDNDQYYEQARRKVKQKKAFRKNLNSYIGTITVLFLINLFTSPVHWWFIYPAFFWGIAIVMQYSRVYGWMSDKYGSPQAEEDAIQEEIERMREYDPNSYQRERQYRQVEEEEDDFVPGPPDELELKEFKKLRKDWDESDFV